MRNIALFVWFIVFVEKERLPLKVVLEWVKLSYGLEKWETEWREWRAGFANVKFAVEISPEAAATWQRQNGGGGLGTEGANFLSDPYGARAPFENAVWRSVKPARPANRLPASLGASRCL